jgi:hypothetical protein
MTDEANQEQSTVQQRRSDLLQRSRETHGQLEALLRDLSDEEMTRPSVTDDWSVKDHLVHLTWWEQRVILMLSGATDPIGAIPNGQEGDDTINAHVHKQNQQRSLEDVRAAFDRSYQEMMDLIATTPDDVLGAKYAWISSNRRSTTTSICARCRRGVSAAWSAPEAGYMAQGRASMVW